MVKVNIGNALALHLEEANNMENYFGDLARRLDGGKSSGWEPQIPSTTTTAMILYIYHFTIQKAQSYFLYFGFCNKVCRIQKVL